MILVITLIIGLFIGGIMGAALAFGVQAHLALRRELKTWQTRADAQEQLRQPVLTAFEAPARHAEAARSPQPDFMGGIGPTAIRNRELFEKQKDQDDKRPKFAHPGILSPELEDIRDAAREATNGGKPN